MSKPRKYPPPKLADHAGLPPGRGGPPGKRAYLAVRMLKEQAMALSKLAQERRMSKAAIVRKALAAYMQNDSSARFRLEGIAKG